MKYWNKRKKNVYPIYLERVYLGWGWVTILSCLTLLLWFNDLNEFINKSVGSNNICENFWSRYHLRFLWFLLWRFMKIFYNSNYFTFWRQSHGNLDSTKNILLRNINIVFYDDFFFHAPDLLNQTHFQQVLIIENLSIIHN